MRSSPHTSFVSLIFAFVVAVFSFACNAPTPGDVKGEMRDAYSAARSLFYFVWAAPDGFSKDNHHQEISQILDRLSQDFHRVEKSAGPLSNDPGFRVALLTNQRLIADARKRFNDDKKDYALWRLRSLTNNCIACHSRYEVPADFIGAETPVAGESFESKFARAQFLLATRQFEAASNEFYALATAPTVSESDAFRSLQLWLVAEVRVKNRAAHTAEKLQQLFNTRSVSPENHILLQSWLKDLKLTEPKSLVNVRNALVTKGDNDLSIQQLNRQLVRTLRASAFLHQFLTGTPQLGERREATYLLALAYSRMPIGSFEVFRELYLEQCIREFPGSKEAQQSFMILDNIVQQENTGSGGLNLEESQRRYLEELRSVAFGSSSSSDFSRSPSQHEQVPS